MGGLKTEAWSDDLYQYVHVNDVVAGLRQALEHADLPPLGVYTLARRIPGSLNPRWKCWRGFVLTWRRT